MNSAIIHSNLSRSPQFLRLTDSAALLMLMALPHCDDYGRLPADLDWWALNICPGRKTIDSLPPLLEEILTRKDKKGVAMLTEYSVDGEDFFLVSKWFKYQSLGSNYVVRSECPHPLLGVKEPNVMGKTLRSEFGNMDDYNTNEEKVRIFLERGEKYADRREQNGKSAQKLTESSQIHSKSSQISSESSQIESRKPPNLRSPCADDKQKSIKSAEQLSRNGPSPASALALASSPASSQALAQSQAQSQAQAPGVAPPEISQNPPGFPGISLHRDLSGGERPPISDGALAMLGTVLNLDNPNLRPDLQIEMGGLAGIRDRARSRLANWGNRDSGLKPDDPHTT